MLVLCDGLVPPLESIGKMAWEKHFAPRKTLIVGYSGANIQRVGNWLAGGLLADFSPKLTILAVGANDSPHGVSGRLLELAAKLRVALPKSRFLIIPPQRNPLQTSETRTALAAECKLLMSEVDGVTIRAVDPSNTMAEPDGAPRPELWQIIKGSQLAYLTANGFEAWADALEPELERVLGKLPPSAAANADRRAAEWALASGNQLTILPEGQTKMVDVVSRSNLPAGRFALLRIEPASGRNREPATDAGLENLRGLTALELVYLRGNDISDVGIAELGSVKSLQTIRIAEIDSKITDVGAARFADLPVLRELTLWKRHDQEPARITDASVEALRRLPLTILRLEGTLVTERAADIITRAWPRLTEVGLPAGALSDAACRTLAKLPALKALHLWGCDIDGPVLRRLAAFQSRPIFELSIQYSSVQDADLAELAPLKSNLSNLSLYSTGVTDAGLCEHCATDETAYIKPERHEDHRRRPGTSREALGIGRSFPGRNQGHARGRGEAANGPAQVQDRMGRGGEEVMSDER